MKIKAIKLTITLGLLVIVAPIVQAQHKAVKDFYRSYKHHDDVHRIQLDGGVFQLLTWVASWDENDEEAAAFSRITKNLKGIDVMVIPNYHKPQKGFKALTRDLINDNFDELMTVREEGSMLYFYAQGNEDEVRDMVIFIDEDDEFVILSLKGTLNMEDMQYLASHHDEIVDN